MVVNYAQVVNDSREELKQQIQKRESVDKRINELRLALRALVRFLADEGQRQQVLKEVAAARRTTPSLTDAVSELLSRAPNGLTSNQIREQLEESGFDLEGYSQPLGAIMTTAQRLVDSGKVKRPATKRGSPVVYKWIEPVINLGTPGILGVPVHGVPLNLSGKKQ
jgi:anti-sigma regulatory factor (Ser/Thr protein kinase)